MIDKFEDNKKEGNIQDDINTEYIGNEETEYIHTTKTEYENIEKTEYNQPSKNKRDEFNIVNQRYKIVEILGQGGMGAVYKALDIRLRNTPVAIKEISLDTIENEKIEKVIENFENEAKTLIQLRHNSIPRIMDFFSLDNNKCYIVMDLIEGETLAQIVKKRGQIPENEVREWLTQLSDVLSYLHNRDPKIIFRDLKPSNVMLTKNNEIKLIDFGIARTFNENKDSDTEYYVSQGFSSPEQYGTGQSDERSDIYSLGALLYSLLIGGKPKIKDFKFESLKNYINISDELDNAIMLATEFRPENRPSSISEFMNLLNLPSKVYDIKTTDDIVEDTKYIRTSKNKPKNNIIVSAITILSLIFGGYIIKNLINTEVETSNTNTKDIVTKTENVRNIKDIKDPTNEEIIRAMDEVYAETNVDKSKVKYEYSPKDNYILEDFIKEDNYVFKSHNIDEKGNIVSTDPYNYLVNKQTFEVMMYFAGGQLAVIDTTIDEKYQKYYYKLNPNIKKAYESIFETVGINGITKYEYRPEEEDGSYSDLRGEYYLFEDYDYFVGNQGDSMIAVHKKTLEVYTYEYAAPDYEDKLIKYGEQPNHEDDEENIDSEKLIRGDFEKYLHYDISMFANPATTEFAIHKDREDKKAWLEVGMNTQAGMKAMLVIDGKGINLMDKCIVPKDALDYGGDLKEGYKIEVGIKDLNNDNCKDIVIACGDGIQELEVNIILLQDLAGEITINHIGNIFGQRYITFNDDGTIEKSYGSQGLFDTYKIDGSKIIDNI